MAHISTPDGSIDAALGCGGKIGFENATNDVLFDFQMEARGWQYENLDIPRPLVAEQPGIGQVHGCSTVTYVDDVFKLKSLQG